VALEVAPPAIANLAVEFLNQLFSSFSPSMQVSKMLFVDECMSRIDCAYAALTGQASTDVAAAAASAAAAAAAPPAPSRQIAQLTIERCLQLIGNYLRGRDETFMHVRLMVPHMLSFRGNELRVRIQTVSSPKNTFLIPAHSNQPLSIIREQVAQVGSRHGSNSNSNSNSSSNSSSIKKKRKKMKEEKNIERNLFPLIFLSFLPSFLLRSWIGCRRA
jgi:hypothetical protein